MIRRRNIMIALGAILIVPMAAVFLFDNDQVLQGDDGLVGEARRGGYTVELSDPVRDVVIAGPPDRPIVVLDAGHGGRDPGAAGISGANIEKDLTLAFVRELRDKLIADRKVRVALTRDDDSTLTLEQRADIAQRLGAALFISVHMDSAPNSAARGATVYSLSDIASDAEAARFAANENVAGGGMSSERDSGVRSLLADLALRDQMEASAALATRLVDNSRSRVLLRPEPHKFAAFHVLRRSQVPGILFEAGYLSNTEDEAMLMTQTGRAPIVASLADAIETEVSILQTP
jgi:N-acetylmuramoyl-L-alanine amidase